MCPAHVSPLAPLDVADYLRPHYHTPSLALPLQFAHAQVPAATSPHATAGIAQQFVHARAPACASSAQGWSRSRSLHRTRVAGLAHAQERCRYSAPQPCRTHTAFFLFRAFVLLWPALVSDFCPSLAGTLFFPFRGTPRHASTHARAVHARTTTDDERRDARSAGVADWKTAARGNTERTLIV